MYRLLIVVTVIITAILCGKATAENIDPHNTGAQYAWGENVGWLNFEPSQGPGVQVSGDKVTGFVWCENIGWISLSCQNTGSCGTVDFGVVNADGKLQGFAWGENVGWINFSPRVPGDATYYGVRLDGDGRFVGWAWGENIGWIRFDATKAYDVQTCLVTLEDLAHFANEWLALGTSPANLDAADNVNMGDFRVFAGYWLDYCPDGWQLKD